MMTTAGTPEPIIAKLNEGLGRVLADAVKKRNALFAVGLEDLTAGAGTKERRRCDLIQRAIVCANETRER